MPIETMCPGCGRKLRVGDEFAGKQARCPVCNEIYSVMVDAEPTRDLPNANSWRLKTPEGQIYGPVLKDELDKWVTDGRVTADCYLAPDESDWERADRFYRVLKEVPTAVHAQFAAGAGASSAVGLQGAGHAGTHAIPSANATRYRYTAAHRGGLILALGLISWFVGCPIFGLFAWIMGNNDLREMRLGRMDPSGMGLTQAGQIIGMIHVILVAIVVIIALGMLLFVTVLAAGAH